jgi:hypothetical protein
MNPWKLTSFVLALVILLFVGLRTIDSAAADPEPQPHMRVALKHLRVAEAELRRANSDKGGHRAKAIELTGAAIDQVQRGIRFDNRR